MAQSCTISSSVSDSSRSQLAFLKPAMKSTAVREETHLTMTMSSVVICACCGHMPRNKSPATS